MVSIEKVIQELESACDYHRGIGNNITAGIAEDALELLKFYKEHEHEVCANCPVDKDYEEVIRCKDCKHWTKEDDRCLEIGWCRVHERRFVEEWYCADGEIRTV